MASEYIRYLRKLYKEYCNSIGIFKIDYRRMHDNLPFRMWLNEYKNKLKYYRYCLYQTGMLQTNIALELEKGFYDTVLSPNDDAYILTEFNNSFNDVSYNKPLNLDFRKPLKGTLAPYESRDLSNDSRTGLSIMVRNSSRIINLFNEGGALVIAHNPYDGKQVTEQLLMASENGFDVSIGVHGCATDQDIDKKLTRLTEITDALGIPISGIESYQHGNDYAYVAKKLVR